MELTLETWMRMSPTRSLGRLDCSCPQLGGAGAEYEAISRSLEVLMGAPLTGLLGCRAARELQLGAAGSLRGHFTVYCPAELGSLTSRGYRTIAERDWSQYTGHCRVHSQD